MPFGLASNIKQARTTFTANQSWAEVEHNQMKGTVIRFLFSSVFYPRVQWYLTVRQMSQTSHDLRTHKALKTVPYTILSNDQH